jgi:hypothetical protein
MTGTCDCRWRSAVTVVAICNCRRARVHAHIFKTQGGGLLDKGTPDVLAC